MQVGMIGLGRMGANMLSRLLAAGHDCVVYDLGREAVRKAEQAGAAGASSLAELVTLLEAPRVVWVMVPAGAVDGLLADLTPQLDRGDILVDGGNSHYIHAIRRAEELARQGLHFLDVGVSGGIWGREIGYCQMIGGPAQPVKRLEPVFTALAAGEREQAAYLHCGSSGAGHFVKMVHNGIEYGLMQAYAEGFNLLSGLRAADAGQSVGATENALPDEPRLQVDMGAIAELWRHGSVVRSWLLDLTAQALARDPALSRFEGQVADSGEGRWALEAATQRGVPVPALAAALFARFSSRGRSDLSDRLLSAMRHEFGGHEERHEP